MIKLLAAQAAALLLVAGGFTLQAQPPAGKVTLNVVALDGSGTPVPDLTAADFAVFDNGVRQSVVSLRLNQSAGPPPLVILFDLLNSHLASRGIVWNVMKQSLARLSGAGPLYLYLLAEDGSLYPVHGLKDAPTSAWTRQAGPLLDAAMRKATQVRPLELAATGMDSLPAAFNTTVNALEAMRARMTVLPGAKELLWVTYGTPSSIYYPDRGWYDGGPFLRQLGARFVQSNIAVYTADPGIVLERGMLKRDSLDILTGATGGRVFSSINLDQAIARVEIDARANYSLAYRPAAGNWDGKYHKLRVTVARKGIHLQNKRGYFAVVGS